MSCSYLKEYDLLELFSPHFIGSLQSYLLACIEVVYSLAVSGGWRGASQRDASPQNDISAPTKWGSLIFQRAFGGVISDGDCGPVVGSDYAIFLKFNSELGVSLVDSGRSWKQHHFFLYIIVVLKKVRQTSLKQFKHFCSVLFWYKEAADWMVINFIPFHFHSMENSKPVRFPPPW